MVGEKPAIKKHKSKSAEQTKKSRKTVSPQTTAHVS